MNIKQLLIFLLFTTGIFFWIETKCYTLKKHDELPVAEDRATPEEKDRGSFYFMLVIALIPTLMGLVGINQWCQTYNLATSSKNWPKTEAVIVKKYIGVQVPVGSGHVSPDQQTYFPQVAYKFYVDGTTYMSEGIAFTNSWTTGNQEKVEEKLSKYPAVGDSISIYYEPNTMRTVIVPGANGMNYFGLIFYILIYPLGPWALRFTVSLW